MPSCRRIFRCLALGALAIILSVSYAPESSAPVFLPSTPEQQPVFSPPPSPPPANPPPASSEPLEPPPVPAVKSLTPDYREQVAHRQQLNPDTVGWLEVPGTDISDVVLQNPFDGDNNYYLNLSFEGLPDKNGTYCADRRCVFGTGGRGELSRNTTIYGHSWDDDPNGELFAQLKRFRDPAFAEATPYIFFCTEGEPMAWEVVAVFESTVDIPYNIPELEVGMFFDTLDIVLDSSIYSYNAVVGPQDKLLTLSTCVFSVRGHESLSEVNNYRFAIMARLADPDEPLRERADFVMNTQPLSPDLAQEKAENGKLRIYTHEVGIRK